MLTTRLCAGSVVPMEDRALSLSLSTVLRDLRDEHPQVHTGVLNLQGAAHRRGLLPDNGRTAVMRAGRHAGALRPRACGFRRIDAADGVASARAK